jgi:hypothetical protein
MDAEMSPKRGFSTALSIDLDARNDKSIA